MLMELIRQFNFLDIVILIILFRICYIAVTMGLPIEFFKLLGVLCATYVSLHYYISLSDIIQRSYLPKNMPPEFMDFLIFLILAAAGYLISVALRSTFYRFIKMEAVPKINKIGGFILGLARGFFAVGLIVYALAISTVSYLTLSVKHSYLGSRAFSIAPQTYSWLWSNLFSKFSLNEKPNPVVSDVFDNFLRK